jgi:hypothetical protein
MTTINVAVRVVQTIAWRLGGGMNSMASRDHVIAAGGKSTLCGKVLDEFKQRSVESHRAKQYARGSHIYVGVASARPGGGYGKETCARCVRSLEKGAEAMEAK